MPTVRRSPSASMELVWDMIDLLDMTKAPLRANEQTLLNIAAEYKHLDALMASKLPPVLPTYRTYGRGAERGNKTKESAGANSGVEGTRKRKLLSSIGCSTVKKPRLGVRPSSRARTSSVRAIGAVSDEGVDGGGGEEHERSSSHGSQEEPDGGGGRSDKETTVEPKRMADNECTISDPSDAPFMPSYRTTRVQRALLSRRHMQLTKRAVR